MVKRMRNAWQKQDIKQAIESNLQGFFGVKVEQATQQQLYKAVATLVQDHIMENWARSEEQVHAENGKELYYLSMEFLVGRALNNNLINISRDEVFAAACRDLDIDFQAIQDSEADPGLGNGGLGRLAACFLDSLATGRLVGHGCGIRYEYGLFRQKIVDGYQLEDCDPWLEHGHIWEVEKPEEAVEVRFEGGVELLSENDADEDTPRFVHRDYQTVKAIPYDVPVLGFDSPVVNTLRLWSARPTRHINMKLFNRGEYLRALAENNLAELISHVLYPEDSHEQGKALRLKQQYFFVSASIQALLAKFKRKGNPLSALPAKVVIHINDTHPVLAIPELLRILLEEGLNWDEAWAITSKTFAYTNHTIMQEALERWPVALFQRLLPQIYCLLEEINERFCRSLWTIFPGNWQTISDMAIIAHDEVRMANLAIAGSFSVNGVSSLHTDILKNQVFRKFYKAFPERFHSITNGITHRRFLYHANPELATLISREIGEKWITEPLRLKEFAKTAERADTRESLRRIRLRRKEALAKYIGERNGLVVDPHSLFDVHVKRLHEYKRQLLNVLHIMALYNQLRENPALTMPPRTFVFAAKAAAAYHMAKLIIKLIHTVGQKINSDPRVKDRLKVVFLENYRVSLAELIIPATDVSEQISTAGKEASGTGNMKFMINGALTVGTLDGANVEMQEAVGADNMYIFGLNAAEVLQLQSEGKYCPWKVCDADPMLKMTLEQLIDGFYTDDRELFRPIYNSLLYGNGGASDPYLVIRDFAAYCEVQHRIGRDYANEELWWKKAILNIANAGVFSSDRTIAEYNEQIWRLPRRDFSMAGLSLSNY